MFKLYQGIKDLLDHDAEVNVGDFVTTNDKIDSIHIYVVKSIYPSGTAIIYGLELTDSMDDAYIYEAIVPPKSLIHLDESYANYGGLLWKVHEQVLRGEEVVVNSLRSMRTGI